MLTYFMRPVLAVMLSSAAFIKHPVSMATLELQQEVSLDYVIEQKTPNLQMKFDISQMKSWDLKGSEDLTEPAGTTEKTSPTENTNMRKSNKIFAFFRRRWKAVKKAFQKNRVEPIGVSAQPDSEPPCVPGPSGPKPELKLDLVEVEPLCDPGPSSLKSGPQMDLVEVEQLCDPGPICPKTEHQVKTELSVLQMYIPQSALQLQDCLEQCTLDWTPVTEVWCNVFIGNEETAMDRAKLKGMGITHILNATASEEDLLGKISTPREEYYQGMNITYYNVPAVDEDWFDISKYFFPASEFIHKALSNPENKVLVHCIHGVSRSSTLVLAYLMIHHNMMVEDAIDHVTDVRWIGPNMGFLNQLTVLNSDLVRQRKLQVKPVPEPSCVPGPEEEPQGKTELLLLKRHLFQNMIQLKQCLEKPALDWTPVTEVWPSVFIGNEETAMDQARLKEMGITHILNASAVKKNLRVLLGIARKEDLLGKTNTGAKYYKGMKISYYGVPVMDNHLFDISKYFCPAAKFIHKALSNPESKVLVHCLDGVRRSPTLFLAYLMIHHDMTVEDAIDHIIKVRRIRPNMGFLKQLIILNSKLLCQRKL